MSLTIADFGAFFSAIHDGQAPFHWQRRLLEHLVTKGTWPDQIAAPTGAGKTSVIDIHVFATALMATGTAVRVPRRLALVVDRRALVDDQYEHARSLSSALDRVNDGVLGRVAAALRLLRAGHADRTRPLMVTRMRGGMPTAREWLDDPTACQVLCATPDMWGSRLLLNGYGTRPMARPREAGLLATDSVVIIDEAHLSRQLLTTARRVATLAAIADRSISVPVLQVVETTATPGDPGNGVVVGVEPDDLLDEPVLRQRLTCAKPIELLRLPAWPLPAAGSARKAGIKAMADRAAELRMTYGPTVGCFVNTIPAALALGEELSRRDHTVTVFCGRMRPFDLSKVRERHPGLLSISGNAGVDFVVTTSTLEVGADLDWSAGLTELAPGAALAQRAGRINRLGRHDTTVVVAIPENDLTANTPSPPYAADDLTTALAWIRERERDPNGLSPWALRDAPPPPQSPRRILYQRPELADSWQWARTSDDLIDEPDLDLWLSDDLDAELDVGIVVRHDLPVETSDAIRLIDALPPRTHETFPATIGAARQMLRARFPDGIASSDYPPPLRVRAGECDLCTDKDLRPGDTIVLDDRVPAFQVIEDTAVVTPDGDKTAADVLEAREGDVVLRIGSGATSPPGPVTDTILTVAAKAVADAGATRAARSIIADALDEDASAVAAHVPAVVRLLRTKPAKASDVIMHYDHDAQPTRLIIVDRRRAVLDEDLRQEWTPSATPVPLRQHANAVAERASDIAVRLGLADDLCVMLRWAGQHHDDGKSEPRFQLSLEADPSDPPLAKSGMINKSRIRTARAASGLPGNWRHEQLSVLASWEQHDVTGEGRLLATRLVGTSHGYGRHSFPHAAADLLGEGHADALASRLFDDGGWDQLIEHTHNVWGVWGCAYLEALLRAADGQISGEGS